MNNIASRFTFGWRDYYRLTKEEQEDFKEYWQECRETDRLFREKPIEERLGRIKEASVAGNLHLSIELKHKKKYSRRVKSSGTRVSGEEPTSR